MPLSIETIFPIILLAGLAIYVGSEKFWFIPQKIKRNLLEIENFTVNAKHIENTKGITVDFSKRLMAYSDAQNVYIFPAHEIKHCQHLWINVPTDQGAINEREHHILIRLRNNILPEISLPFPTRACAQRCENSLEKLIEYEVAYQTNILTQTPPEPIQINSEATIVNQPSPPSPKTETTSNNKQLEKRFINLLENKGIPRNDGISDITRAKFNKATDLIFSEYKTLFGPKLKHKEQKAVERALYPFFEYQGNAPKGTGFTRGSIGKYLSENKKVWSEKCIRSSANSN